MEPRAKATTSAQYNPVSATLTGNYRLSIVPNRHLPGKRQ